MDRNAYELLTPQQAAAVEARLEEENKRALPVVVALSGSRAYGFPAPDSDVDVKAVHIDPTEGLLGLRPETTSRNCVMTQNGVVVDYTSNEVGAVLQGVLQGNGSYIERVLGGLYFGTSTVLDEAREVLHRSLSRRIANYYGGFARAQLRELERSKHAKDLLYVLRTLLTGTHLLRAGEVVLDLPTLLSLYGLHEAMYVVEARRAGAREVESTVESDGWLPRAFALLEDARSTTPLPAEPANEAEVDAWLVSTRLLMV